MSNPIDQYTKIKTVIQGLVDDESERQWFQRIIHQISGTQIAKTETALKLIDQKIAALHHQISMNAAELADIKTSLETLTTTLSELGKQALNDLKVF